MKRTLQIIVGLAIAIGLMALLFKDVSWTELRASFGKMSVGWFAVAQIPIWASFFLRIQRWSYVVRAVHPASFRAMFNSTQLAFLINFTIGLRLGEFVRPLVLSRLTRMSFAKALAVNALDRVNDLLGLIAVMIVGMTAFRPQHDIVLPKGTLGLSVPYTIPKSVIVTGSQGAAVFLAVVLIGLVLVYVNQRLVLRLTRAVLGVVSEKLAAWTCRMIEQFADGLHVFRNVGDMAKSIAFSLLTWACFLAAYACLFEAFGLDWPWYSVFIVQMLLAFSISAPGVPGMMGQFHLPIVIGMLMTIPQATLPDCLAVALVTHAANMAPICVFGLYALWREGVSLSELKHEVDEAEEIAEKMSDEGK